MNTVDLNSDLGEGFGSYTLGLDEEIIRQVSSVNIACGWHGGDPLIMEKTVAAAVKYGCAIGAHTGFPDLMGFGRRNMTLTPDEARTYTKYQLGALMAFTRAHGVAIQHVKPHGALYNMAAVDYKLALAIAQGIYEVDSTIVFLGLSGSKMIEAAQDVGLRTACEVFADRGYAPDGTLVPRGQPGAFIHDAQEAAERVIRMVQSGVVACADGSEIALTAHSVCLHGDNPQAVTFAQTLRSALTQKGITIANLRQIVGA